ncbi:hypothetical protein PHLGIDRAFT_238306 [Phlebiopsis gigantea 11061_1 CR5-6]|uniref:Uncharacterized protein n=1 Tax=Phlebiopsis gigantea (strain 11061_1 CR5-6) TaxID=745531 RepID=A0A0C3NFH5_PHLG1|nr:hypothetical protein PHLGIDRAFT_238306 [Phlebiopsis gigantea 11061_1 CR5-6]
MCCLVSAVRVRRGTRAEAQREEQYALLLDSVQLAAEIVGTLADGALNVPGLKSAAGLAVQIVRMAKAVRLNRQDCDELVEQVCGCFEVVAEELQRAAVLDHRLNLALHAFQRWVARLQVRKQETHRDTRELGRVRDLVEVLSSRRYITRFFFHTSDRRAIEDCKTRIAKAFQRLELGHMIRSEQKLMHISGGMGVISRDVRDLYSAQEAHARRLQLDLLQIDYVRRREASELKSMFSDLITQLPVSRRFASENFHLTVRLFQKDVGFKAKEYVSSGNAGFVVPAQITVTSRYIRLMSPAKILWHQWALADAAQLNRTASCFRQDAETWVEAKMVARILRDWPSATRAIVSGWDFASHDEHMHTHDTKFYIHIEYADRRRRRHVPRYVLFALHATGLDGKEGPAMSLDENAGLVQDEMDEASAVASREAPYVDSTNIAFDPDAETAAGGGRVPPWTA